MKILRSSSLSSKLPCSCAALLVFFVTAQPLWAVQPSPSPSPLPAPTVVIKGQGSLQALAPTSGVWRNFQSSDPLLISYRVQRVEGSCQAWAQALLNDSIPHAAVFKSPLDIQNHWDRWTPWTASDREAVTECGSFPCNVKLDASEVKSLALVEATVRMQQYQKLVLARVSAYLTQGERRPYEFPGGIADPWKFFENEGLGATQGILKNAPSPSFLIRQLDFAPGKIRVLRQVLDRRQWQDTAEATVWIRDVYTDHYFDSWGEWGHVLCDNGKAIVAFALLTEFDLLKQTDLLNRLARGRMRSAVREGSEKLLDQWFERVRLLAEKK